MKSMQITIFAILTIAAFSSPVPDLLDTLQDNILLPDNTRIECGPYCRKNIFGIAEKLGCVHPLFKNTINRLPKLECEAGKIDAEELRRYLKYAGIVISDTMIDRIHERINDIEPEEETGFDEDDTEDVEPADPDIEVLNGGAIVKEGESTRKEGEGTVKVGEAMTKEGHAEIEQAQGLTIEGKDETAKEKLEQGEAKVESGKEKVAEGEATIEKGEETVAAGQEMMERGQTNYLE